MLSQLFHENSKLNKTLDGPFGEQVADFSQDLELIKASMQASRHYPGHEQIKLPGAFPAYGPPLYSILRRRRSRRQFKEEAISLDSLAKLLWYGAGETEEVTHPAAPELVQKLRVAPSAGGFNSIELYLLVNSVESLARGVYHYHSPTHSLAKLGGEEEVEKAWSHLLLLEGMEKASLCFVLSGSMELLKQKYGERGYRFLLLDAGHYAQNLLLAAEALQLAAVCLGGFHDDGLDENLGLAGEAENSLYPVLVGCRT